MSIALQGLDSKLKSTPITISVSSRHRFTRLGNGLDWRQLADLVMLDLQQTTAKGRWNLGRKLQLRIHLGVYVLQCLLKETDRGVESRIWDTPVYQVFCGRGIIPGWKCPDHTKVEEFRNRLTPETHQKIGVFVVKTAQDLGFADPTWMDVDSTIQEANIAYPSDASLMKKLSEKANKVIEYLRSQRREYFPEDLSLKIEEIVSAS